MKDQITEGQFTEMNHRVIIVQALATAALNKNWKHRAKIATAANMAIDRILAEYNVSTT